MAHFRMNTRVCHTKTQEQNTNGRRHYARLPSAPVPPWCRCAPSPPERRGTSRSFSNPLLRSPMRPLSVCWVWQCWGFNGKPTGFGLVTSTGTVTARGRAERRAGGGAPLSFGHRGGLSHDATRAKFPLWSDLPQLSGALLGGSEQPGALPVI